jgi:hypothetical protein
LGGWHGDGNYARTAIMYCLWKTQGTHIFPWREDLIIGAEKTGEETYIVINAQNDWEGKLVFDTPRHKTILNLPIDYPRINQFPEWFVAEENDEFPVVSSQKELNRNYSGKELIKGIPLKISAGEQLVLVVK